MITKNFKNHLYCISVTSGNGSAEGLLPIRAYNNTNYYDTGYVANQIYPYSPSQSFILSNSGTGIIVGSGTTAPTENDYKLESQITSGLSGSVVKNEGIDNNGNPYITFDITITNTSSSSITISEIGYQQNINGTATQGSSGASSRPCLFDRTVLDTPVTIPSHEYAVIRYVIKTIVPSGE